MCQFAWPWLILSELAKYSVSRSIARHLCDNWTPCFQQDKTALCTRTPTNASNDPVRPAPSIRVLTRRIVNSSSNWIRIATSWTCVSRVCSSFVGSVAKLDLAQLPHLYLTHSPLRTALSVVSFWSETISFTQVNHAATNVTKKLEKRWKNDT